MVTAEAEQELRVVPVAQLLTSAYALTHQIHEAEECGITATKLRGMRDLATAEIVRRAEPAAVHTFGVFARRWRCSCGSRGLKYAGAAETYAHWEQHVAREARR